MSDAQKKSHERATFCDEHVPVLGRRRRRTGVSTGNCLSVGQKTMNPPQIHRVDLAQLAEACYHPAVQCAEDPWKYCETILN